jgi:hypothetical protein
MNVLLPCLLILSIIVLPTKACSCLEVPTVSRALQSGTVVSGLVLREIPTLVPDPPLSVRKFLVLVEKVYSLNCKKNPISFGQHIVVTTPRNSCGVRLMVLRSYVFSGTNPLTDVPSTDLLGTSNATDATLFVSACTFVRPWVTLTKSERQELKASNFTC